MGPKQVTCNYGNSWHLHKWDQQPSATALQRDPDVTVLRLPEMLLSHHTQALKTLMAIHLFNSFIAFEYFMCTTLPPPSGGLCVETRG